MSEQSKEKQIAMLQAAAPQSRLERLRQAVAKCPAIEMYVRQAEIEFEKGKNPDHLEIKLLLAEKVLLHEVAAPGAIKHHKLDSRRRNASEKVSRDDIAAALKSHGGNVTHALEELKKSCPGYKRESLDKRIRNNPDLKRIRDEARERARGNS